MKQRQRRALQVIQTIDHPLSEPLDDTDYDYVLTIKMDQDGSKTLTWSYTEGNRVSVMAQRVEPNEGVMSTIETFVNKAGLK